MPIGAEQTTTGYEVAWKMPGDQYTVWNTDSSGNYISQTAIVSGTSATLESLETSFHQDLNGDGVIGLAVRATAELVGTASESLKFISVADNSTVNILVGADHDTFFFKPNFGQATITPFTPGNDTIQINPAVSASMESLLAAIHNDSHSNSVITDATHDATTFQNVNAAQLHAHPVEGYFV
jgi:hypothetical protein